MLPLALPLAALAFVLAATTALLLLLAGWPNDRLVGACCPKEARVGRAKEDRGAMIGLVTPMLISVGSIWGV